MEQWGSPSSCVGDSAVLAEQDTPGGTGPGEEEEAGKQHQN